jgi:hypothetical protein
MFDRAHHQRIAKVLHAFDSGALSQTQCYFGGGTAIAMSLAEYRESRDVDFLCASNEGYRLLRNIISPNGFGSLLREPLNFRREVRADMYGIRAVVEVDGEAIKVEIVSEGRIGEHVVKAFHDSAKLVCDRDYLKHCLRAMHMEEGLLERIPAILECSDDAGGRPDTTQELRCGHFNTHPHDRGG